MIIRIRSTWTQQKLQLRLVFTAKAGRHHCHSWPSAGLINYWNCIRRRSRDSDSLAQSRWARH
eukprot:1897584-Rhodomonas_salina.2